MSADILELEKNQMLPETELEQETVYVYRRQQGRGAGGGVSDIDGIERQDTVGRN